MLFCFRSEGAVSPVGTVSLWRGWVPLGMCVSQWLWGVRKCWGTVTLYCDYYSWTHKHYPVLHYGKKSCGKLSPSWGSAMVTLVSPTLSKGLGIPCWVSQSLWLSSGTSCLEFAFWTKAMWDTAEESVFFAPLHAVVEFDLVLRLSFKSVAGQVQEFIAT